MQNETRYGFFVDNVRAVWRAIGAFAILLSMKKSLQPRPVADIAPSAAHAAPRKKRFLRKALSAAAALYLFADLFGKAQFVTCRYEIEDARIQSDVRIAIVSDLHGALYGAGQSEIVDTLETAKPHAVLLLGDLFDQHGNNENTVTLLHALAGRFKCYFILGNHEYKSGETVSIRAAIEAAGIPILDGASAVIRSDETEVRLYGIDDGRGGKAKQLQQIADAAAQRSDDEFSILAIHVPNGVESYLHYGFDLMLAGHTHGGQIVVPGVLNGLYAPGQGFFPKYGGGRYDFGNQTLIISRGLARKPFWLPRICNPPELTLVTLKPRTGE